MEKLKKRLESMEKCECSQKRLFKLALKEYAINELAAPKIRNLMYKQKMTISNCVHPTNDYRYRLNFIEK